MVSAPSERGARAEVDHALDARELLLDRRGHGLRDGLGARAGVGRGDGHRGRRDLRVLRDRQREARHQARERDDDRDHAREDRPLDEEAGEVAHAPLPAAGRGLAGAREAPARAPPCPGAASRGCPRSPASPSFRPAVTTMSEPSQLAVCTGLARRALPSGPTTMTMRACSVCSTAACGTSDRLLLAREHAHAHELAREPRACRDWGTRRAAAPCRSRRRRCVPGS